MLVNLRKFPDMTNLGIWTMSTEACPYNCGRFQGTGTIRRLQKSGDETNVILDGDTYGILRLASL